MNYLAVDDAGGVTTGTVAAGLVAHAGTGALTSILSSVEAGGFACAMGNLRSSAAFTFRSGTAQTAGAGGFNESAEERV